MPTVAGIYYYAHEPENSARPPIIIVHGAGGTHLFWPPQIRRLAGQRIIAVDLPGHGKSEGVGRQIIDDYAKDIIEFMKALKLRTAVMVGHSMGSAIAMTMALKFPKRVSGLVLIGGGAKLRVAPTVLEASANPSAFHAAVDLITQYSFGSTADLRLTELASQRLLETRPAVLYGDFLACDSFNVMDKLKKLNAPTLIVCGEEDRMTPLKYSEYLCDGISGAHLETIPGAGHMVMLEQPAKVADVLNRFLNTLNKIRESNPK
jgi:pimeloyl-ACP methyl ester carboxylesterase